MINKNNAQDLTTEELKICYNEYIKRYRINHKQQIKHIKKRSYNKNKPIKESIKINPISFNRLG